MGHFVSSPREREKRDRRDSRGDEREGQGRKRNRNEREETEGIKTFPSTITCYKDSKPLSVGCPGDVRYITPLPATPNHPCIFMESSNLILEGLSKIVADSILNVFIILQRKKNLAFHDGFKIKMLSSAVVISTLKGNEKAALQFTPSQSLSSVKIITHIKTITTLCASFLIVFLFFPRKQALTFYANCFQRRQFA